MTASSSDTGWAATGMPKPENWLFLAAPLRSGKNRIQLDLLAGEECARLSAWVWAKKPGQAGSASTARAGDDLARLPFLCSNRSRHRRYRSRASR